MSAYDRFKQGETLCGHSGTRRVQGMRPVQMTFNTSLRARIFSLRPNQFYLHTRIARIAGKAYLNAPA